MKKPASVDPVVSGPVGNRAAVEVMLSGGVPAGLEPYAEGLRSLASLLDVEGDEKVWREYRMLLKDYREAANRDSDRDTFGELIAEINSRAKVGDSSDAG